MQIYADYDYYKSGVFGNIPEEEFARYAKLASQEMDKLTHGRITAAGLEEIKDCCCEMADVIYNYEKSHNSENGALVSSYSNDGQSATFDLSTTERTLAGSKRRILGIAHVYLLPLGYMYPGVRQHA